ncbi:MAG: hypothetical protein Alpg2KO_02820 [Alphaproteobacteria bacterium]
MRVYAIIPARGGSKGIPRKNLREINGRSLLGRCIDAAKGVTGIDEVWVSTDCPDHKAHALDCGAKVIDRPAELSGDRASSEAAVTHAVEMWDKADDRPDVLVFLQCTSPFTIADDIAGTLAEVTDKGADTALAVTTFHYFLWKPDDSGDWHGVGHDRRVRLLRQQIHGTDKETFLETGAVYVMKTDGYMTHKHRFFGRTGAHVMPEERVFEIDEPHDLVRAEELAKVLDNQH